MDRINPGPAPRALTWDQGIEFRKLLRMGQAVKFRRGELYNKKTGVALHSVADGEPPKISVAVALRWCLPRGEKRKVWVEFTEVWAAKEFAKDAIRELRLCKTNLQYNEAIHELLEKLREGNPDIREEVISADAEVENR